MHSGRDRALSGEGGELSSFFDGSSPVLCGADRPSNPLGRQFSDEGARTVPSQAPSTHGSTSKRRWTPSGASVSQEAATSGWVAAPRKLQKKAKTSFSHLATRGTPKVSQLMSPPVFFSPPQFPSPAAFTLPPSAYVPPPDDADTMPPPVILSRTPRMQPARPTARRLTPNSSGRSARALSDECAESGEALPPRLPLEQGVLYDAMHGGGGGTSARRGSVPRGGSAAEALLAPLERFGLSIE